MPFKNEWNGHSTVGWNEHSLSNAIDVNQIKEWEQFSLLFFLYSKLSSLPNVILIHSLGIKAAGEG